MDKLMEDIIETAHNFTINMQEHGLTLDYSAESLREVDDLLEAFRQEALDEDGRFNLFSMVGCYVFETARRCYGGKYFWIEEEQQPILVAGLPEFSVGMKAWEKVQGRLANGKEDNIPFYVAGYSEHIEKAQKGTRVTIV